MLYGYGYVYVLIVNIFITYVLLESLEIILKKK